MNDTYQQQQQKQLEHNDSITAASSNDEDGSTTTGNSDMDMDIDIGNYTNNTASCSCRGNVHYAYIVLAVATLGKVFTSPGQSPCIGVIIEDVRLDLDISRSMLTGLYFAATTMSALMLPLGGRCIDKFGPRAMVGVFSFGLGLACVAMSQVAGDNETTTTTRAQEADDAVKKVLHCLHLLFAFFLLRFFGQGNLMNVSTTEINYWWVERRGLVNGISGSVQSATMLGIIPIIMMSLMSSVGWRQTYMILGMASLFVMAPLGLLFFRDKPEQYGLLPDAKVKWVVDTTDNDKSLSYIESAAGEVERGSNDDDILNNNTTEVLSSEDKEEDTATLLDKEEDVDWTTEEVYRSRAFYAFAISDLIINGTGTAFWFHLHSTFQESGASETTISTLYPILAVVSVISRLFSGWLIDVTSQRHVMSIGLFLHSMGLALVPVMMMIPRTATTSHSIFDSRSLVAYAVALLVGSSASFCLNVRATIYAEYYGRKHLGAVQSMASSLTVFGSATGPFLFGIARDLTGSFALPFGVASIFPLVAALVVMAFGKRGPHMRRPMVKNWLSSNGSCIPSIKGYGAV